MTYVLIRVAEDRFVIGTVQKWAVTKDSIKLFPSVHGSDLDYDF